jgi:HAD superfamily hydrolase (TIGR01549 family)
MTVDAVLFDLDNTLYPYAPCNEAGKQGALAAARERGYDLNRETFEDLYQQGRRETKRDTAGAAAAHSRTLYFKHALRAHAGRPVPGDALALGEAFWSAYIEAIEPFPRLEETLAELADAGVAVGITTDLTTRIQLRKLQALGIDERVHAVVTSEEAGREKPGSVLFTLSLARLNCRPSEAVMVGDDPAKDIAGGNAVGLETVLFNGEVLPEAPPEHHPDHEVESLEAVLEVAL